MKVGGMGEGTMPNQTLKFSRTNPKFYYLPSNLSTKGLAIEWWMSQTLIHFPLSNNCLEPSHEP
jgi:hypothetical protein